MMNDQELADTLKLARDAHVTVHVRGTDDRPIVQLLDKFTRREVGGIELKRRLSK